MLVGNAQWTMPIHGIVSKTRVHISSDISACFLVFKSRELFSHSLLQIAIREWKCLKLPACQPNSIIYYQCNFLCFSFLMCNIKY